MAIFKVHRKLLFDPSILCYSPILFLSLLEFYFWSNFYFIFQSLSFGRYERKLLKNNNRLHFNNKKNWSQCQQVLFDEEMSIEVFLGLTFCWKGSLELQKIFFKFDFVFFGPIYGCFELKDWFINMLKMFVMCF